MAPKRLAPPQLPTSPVASSDETASGSGSEEEEEEIAHSPPPAAPKSIAPPPQKDQESEASDEDEDGEEEGEEDEEEDQESEASDEDEDGEEEDEEEEEEDEKEEGEDKEEEDEKANHVALSSATKNPPPPPPATREESETFDEEEEEEEDAGDEVPQKKPAPNQEVEAKGAKRPSALFQRTWSADDEFRILEALAVHRREHGTLPQPEELADALAGKLDNSGCSVSDLRKKVTSLYSRIGKAVKKDALPSKDDRRLFDLSKSVWPSFAKAATKKVPTKPVAANSGAGREPDGMCELYPYLAKEVKELQKAWPGLYNREFMMIDDSKARALDEKIKKERHVRMRLDLRRHDLIKEVAKTLMDLDQ